MAKQVFNIIVFTDNLTIGNKGYITYHKVNNIDKFILFTSGKYPKWKFITVYDNKTKAKLDVIKNKL